MTKEGALGTANSPIHMVASEGGFRAQAWRLFRTLAVLFVVLSAAGAMIEEKGFGKGELTFFATLICRWSCGDG